MYGLAGSLGHPNSAEPLHMFKTFNLKTDNTQGSSLESTGIHQLPSHLHLNSHSLMQEDYFNPGDRSSEIKKSSRSNDKSKRGCLTCKYRKKKCDETKPICRDCLRFGKECVWVDYNTMSGDEIRDLRMKVKNQECNNKIRKRRRTVKRLGEAKEGTSQSEQTPENDTAPRHPMTIHTSTDHLPKIHNLHSELPSNLAPSTLPLLDTVMPTLGSTMPPLNDTDLQPPPTAFNSVPQGPSSLDVDLYHDIHEEPTSFPTALLNLYGELSPFLPDQNKLFPNNNNHDNENEEDKALFFRQKDTPFSIPSFLEQINSINVESPSRLGLLASNFNATFSLAPQPHPAIYPDLDSTDLHLYNYYVSTLSIKVSIAPESQNESNSYQRVFLPLAQKDRAVLYGILAWAGFHMGGEWHNKAIKFAEKSVRLLTSGVDFSGRTPARCADRNSILNKLAALLILCGAEICRGDVKYWSIYHNWCWKLLKDNGGILNFGRNKEEHWLITNFAYHDVMDSSISQRGPYIPPDVSQVIFKDQGGMSRGNLSPLLGVSKTLYLYIAEISSLSHYNYLILDKYYNRGSPKNSPEDISGSSSSDDLQDGSRPDHLLMSVISKAEELEAKIDLAKPDPEDFLGLNSSDLELQLTIFEAFQISCKLYIRQSIFKCNPSSLISQLLLNDLFKCIDVLIKSPVQATLVFPLFIGGIHLVTEFDREIMRARLDDLIQTYGPWNVIRIKRVIEEVWKRNPYGDAVVDWLGILREFNWNVSFA